MSAITLLDDLRGARESYERSPVGRDEASKFWRGLVNRWNNALAIARKLTAEAPAKKPIDGEVLGPKDPGPIDPGEPSPTLRPGALIAAAVLFFMEQKMTGQPHDLSKLFELIENPVLQKLFGGGAVTLAELRTLPGAVLGALGHAQPALPAPDKPVTEPVPPPVASAPVASAKSSVLPGLAGGLSITGLIAALMGTGVMGTPFDMGQAPTTTGTIGAVIGALAPVIGAAGGFAPIVSIGLRLLGGLGSWASSKKTTQ